MGLNREAGIQGLARVLTVKGFGKTHVCKQTCSQLTVFLLSETGKQIRFGKTVGVVQPLYAIYSPPCTLCQTLRGNVLQIPGDKMRSWGARIWGFQLY